MDQLSDSWLFAMRCHNTRSIIYNRISLSQSRKTRFCSNTKYFYLFFFFWKKKNNNKKRMSSNNEIAINGGGGSINDFSQLESPTLDRAYRWITTTLLSFTNVQYLGGNSNDISFSLFFSFDRRTKTKIYFQYLLSKWKEKDVSMYTRPKIVEI